MAGSYWKKKPLGKTMILGIISVMLYAILLMNQDIINSYFGKGSLYALLPIITAFMFSVVHGSFTGNFWTLLGIKAKKKKEVK
ncbi:MAG: hypothetical protein AABY78_05680 [Nitrospirota bacterium]